MFFLIINCAKLVFLQEISGKPPFKTSFLNIKYVGIGLKRK